ncbi:polysaccharide biosynthesis protein [Nocardia sp. CA-129566]|uniref:polysaccharide biosynthesis protein n=1 Tax=Nocardia sp. CA-129566 TaxID=3239976 RepID=UPI003D962B77
MPAIRRLPVVADLTLVTAGAMTANVAGYLLQMLASRWLGVSGYSEFASLLAVQLLCAVPALALQNVVARELVRGARVSALRRLQWRCAVIVAVVAAALVPLVTVVLNVGVIACAAALGAAPALVLLSGEQGILQGGRRFRALAIVLGTAGIARVTPALVVLALGGTAAPALWAAALGIIAAAALARYTASTPPPRPRPTVDTGTEPSPHDGSEPPKFGIGSADQPTRGVGSGEPTRGVGSGEPTRGVGSGEAARGVDSGGAARGVGSGEAAQEVGSDQLKSGVGSDELKRRVGSGRSTQGVGPDGSTRAIRAEGMRGATRWVARLWAWGVSGAANRGAHAVGVVPVLRAAQVQAALMALSSADLIVARIVLGEADASRYALGAIAAKIAFWLPQAVGVVLYPRMAQPTHSARAIRDALAVLSGIGIIAVIGAAVAAPVAPLFAGQDYAPIQGLLWLFALQGAILAVLQGALLSAIAVDRTALAALTWLGLAVELVLISFARSVPTLITTAVCVAAATTVVVALIVLRTADRSPSPT